MSNRAADPATKGHLTGDALDLFLDMAAIASPPGEERAMGDYVLEFAKRHGLEAWEDGSADVVDGNCGNIIVTVPATDSGRPPVMFCAHLDTVPVGGPAIKPRIEGDYVKSDGTTILGADNKASLAAMLTATLRAHRGSAPHGKIELVLTVKEETGCEGSKALDIGRLSARTGYVYDHAATVGTYVSAAPAGFLVSLRFLGTPAHAGIDPEKGRSAIVAAGRTLAKLETGRLDDGSTVNPGLVKGGTAHNIIADYCEVSVDVRSRTRVRALALLDELRQLAGDAARAAGCRLEFDYTEKYTDYRFKESDEVVQRALEAFAIIGVSPQPVLGGGGADANVFNEKGLPCLNIGSGMEFVHTTNERIAIAEIEKMTDLTTALIEL